MKLKRVLCLFLILCLSFSLLPAAFAEDEEIVIVDTEDEEDLIDIVDEEGQPETPPEDQPVTSAVIGVMPAVSCNVSDENFWVHGSVVNSYLYVDSLGNYVRVEYIDGTVYVETYSSDFVLLSTRQIEAELERFGGFYAGSEYFYLIYGQSNLDESSEQEVIRVVKYSRDWRRLGQASLRGANTVGPFGYGSLRCTEVNGFLYVRTCHLMYKTSDGFNHQASMTLVVNESDMSVADVMCNIWNLSSTYVSHSFNQFVLAGEDGRVVLADHGDGYPRSIVLQVTNGLNSDGTLNYSGKRNYHLLEFPGEIGDNYTGGSIGGLEESGSGYLLVGNCNPVRWADDSIRNAFIAYVDKSTGEASELRWLSDYPMGSVDEATPDDAKGASTPQIVKFNDDLFLVIWEVNDKGNNRPGAGGSYFTYATGELEYLFVNGRGEPVSETMTGEGNLSDCKPVLIDGEAVWYVTDSSCAPVFYRIDTEGTLQSSWAVAPTVSAKMLSSGKPEISWEALYGTAVYLVYVSTKKDSGYTVLDSTTETSLTHSEAKAGTTYYYKVLPLKYLGIEGRYSNVVSQRCYAGKPAISTQPKSQTAAAGEKAAFTVKASEADTYQWQFRKSSSDSWSNCSSGTAATLTVEARTYRDGYQYRCKVSNVFGYVYSSAATLRVKPGITAQPKSQTAAPGTSVSFTVKADGADSYQWYFRKSSTDSWSKCSNGTKASLTVEAKTYRNGYQYRCKLTNSAGTTYSNAATLTVASKPTITTQPKSVSVSAGATASFTVKASGAQSYQWQFRKSSSDAWSSCSGGSSATLKVEAKLYRDGYQYRCKLTNNAGSVYTEAATLRVKPGITVQPEDRSASAGETVKFTVKAVGADSYQWYFRKSSSGSWSKCTGTGATTATLSVEAKSYRNGYQYRCLVKNAAGQVYSSAATLTVT